MIVWLITRSDYVNWEASSTLVEVVTGTDPDETQARVTARVTELTEGTDDGTGWGTPLTGTTYLPERVWCVDGQRQD